MYILEMMKKDPTSVIGLTVGVVINGVIDAVVGVVKDAELIVKEILNISDEVITLSDSPEWLICEKLGVNHDWRRQDNFWS